MRSGCGQETIDGFERGSKSGVWCALVPQDNAHPFADGREFTGWGSSERPSWRQLLFAEHEVL